MPQPMSSTSRPAHGASDCDQRGDRRRHGRPRGSRSRRPAGGARCSGSATASGRVSVGAVTERVRCGRARWGSGTGRRRCRGCRSGRPTRPSRPRGAGRPTGRATPRRGPGRRRSPGPPGRPRRSRRHSGGRRGRCPTATKNGSCGSACRPLTPSCFQSSSRPSGRCRLPLTASRPRRASCGRDVVDRDDPAEPAAAECGAGAHRLPERGLVGCRVVEDLDDLEVGAVGQREDRVAGAEAGVDSAGGELLTEQLRESLRWCRPARRGRLRRRCGPGAWLILTRPRSAPDTGVRRSARWTATAGCSASADRERRCASHAAASTSYAACPIRVISSVALER